MSFIKLDLMPHFKAHVWDYKMHYQSLLSHNTYMRPPLQRNYMHFENLIFHIEAGHVMQ